MQRKDARIQALERSADQAATRWAALLGKTPEDGLKKQLQQLQNELSQRDEQVRSAEARAHELMEKMRVNQQKQAEQAEHTERLEKELRQAQVDRA